MHISDVRRVFSAKTGSGFYLRAIVGAGGHHPERQIYTWGGGGQWEGIGRMKSKKTGDWGRGGKGDGNRRILGENYGQRTDCLCWFFHAYVRCSCRTVSYLLFQLMPQWRVFKKSHHFWVTCVPSTSGSAWAVTLWWQENPSTGSWDLVLLYHQTHNHPAHSIQAWSHLEGTESEWTAKPLEVKWAERKCRAGQHGMGPHQKQDAKNNVIAFPLVPKSFVL